MILESYMYTDRNYKIAWKKNIFVRKKIMLYENCKYKQFIYRYFKILLI